MRSAIMACLACLLVGGLALGQAPPREAPETSDPDLVVGPAPAASETIQDDTPISDGESAGSCGTGCSATNRFWVSSEYLLWFIKDSHYPLLVTSGSPTDALPGAVGMPGTQVLFGGTIDNQARSGARVAVGAWLDPDGRVGAEAGYLFLGRRSVSLNSAASGTPGTGAVIARPFVNALTSAQDASLDAYPGLASGGVDVTTSSALQGAEANALLGLWDGPSASINLVAGFRYLHLDEKLRIQEDVAVSTTAASFAGDQIGVLDQFNTTNDFYGANVGAQAALRWSHWEALLTAKVALGDVHESTVIGGATGITTPGGTTTVTPGGLLALPTNSGTFHRDTFAVVPEIGVRVDYRIGRYLHAFAGYSFLYWSDVVRPGDQIDPTINVNQVPTSKSFGAAGGPSRPAFSFHGSEFWAQGVSFGMEFRY